jgi:mono/diheme cytochrome c family protein
MRRLPTALAAALLALAAGCGGGENTSANQSTEPDVTTGTGATTTTGGAGGGGDAHAGELTWVVEGCSNCHTLGGDPAKSQDGPNFDEKLPDRETIIEVTRDGKGTMPGFGDSLAPQDFENLAAYIAERSRA